MSRLRGLKGTNGRTVRGTGIATAIMAGTAVTMLQVNPNLTPEEVKRILLETKDALEAVKAAKALGAVMPSDIHGTLSYCKSSKSTQSSKEQQ